MARCARARFRLFARAPPPRARPLSTLSSRCAPSPRRAAQVKFAINTETGEKVAVKILDKEKIQKQNMGAQIKKEARECCPRGCFSSPAGGRRTW